MDGEIEPATLATRLADDAASAPLVVDVRPPAAFRRGHIPDSLNIPLSALTDRIEAVDGAEHVVTVCPHGEASVQAARLIAAYEGFSGRAESLRGGLEAWDGPLATDDGERATDEPEAPF